MKFRKIDRALCSEFLKCDKGANAVEFAIVAPVFLAIVFSILELGFVFLVDLSVENALISATRLIRTGQVQAQEMSPDQFRQTMCQRANALVDCSKLKVDVMQFDTFGAGNSLPSALDSDGKVKADSLFEAGAPNSIIVARSTYVHKLFTLLGIGKFFSNYGDNEYLMQHVSAFKNEPF